MKENIVCLESKDSNICLFDYPYGRTLVTVKLDESYYMLEIQKDVFHAFLEFWPKGSGTQLLEGKHGKDSCYVSVKKDAFLTREFFKQIGEIAEAQRIVDAWSHVLH